MFSFMRSPRTPNVGTQHPSKYPRRGLIKGPCIQQLSTLDLGTVIVVQVLGNYRTIGYLDP